MGKGRKRQKCTTLSNGMMKFHWGTDGRLSGLLKHTQATAPR